MNIIIDSQTQYIIQDDSINIFLIKRVTSSMYTRCQHGHRLIIGPVVRFRANVYGLTARC